MTEQIAILRQCRRCGEHKSIDDFDGLAVLCRGCTRMDSKYQTTSRIALIRGYALTDKAREFLAAERATV